MEGNKIIHDAGNVGIGDNDDVMGVLAVNGEGGGGESVTVWW